jgi:hypothetical protein
MRAQNAVKVIIGIFEKIESKTPLHPGLVVCFLMCVHSADEDIDSTFPTNVVLSSNGDCLWVPPGLFRSTCKIDITWFPFDEQHCSMKFGSWTYDSSGINLQLQAENGDTSSFIINGEWLLIGLSHKICSYIMCSSRPSMAVWCK